MPQKLTPPKNMIAPEKWAVGERSEQWALSPQFLINAKKTLHYNKKMTNSYNACF